jgi:putative ABC transport system permease protein
VNALELVRLALSRLASARLRSALTMLGIIIGVASVVALVGVGQGATSGITNRLEGLGTNLLTVNPGSSTSGLTRQAVGSATTLTIDDASAIAGLAGVAGVAPQVTTQGLVIAGSKNTTTQIIGTTSAYLSVRAFSIWQGTFLTDASVEHGLRLAVIGATTADDLGLNARSIGTEITIGKIPFQVVGILQAKGSQGIGNQDDMVIVPLTTVRHYFLPGDTVRSIGLSVASADQIETVKATIKLTLEERHGISASASDDFTISDQAQLLETAASVGSLLSILLAGIASISLIVGGIGVMNIMLVSVRERTREIGIRKAIGARGSDILAQFIVEALALSVLGGLIGAVLGIGVSIVIATVAGWAFTFNPLTVLAALGVSLVVGVVFGVWPARQAARLDPIAALHYE